MPIDPLVEFLVTIYVVVTLPGKSLVLFLEPILGLGANKSVLP